MAGHPARVKRVNSFLEHLLAAKTSRSHAHIHDLPQIRPWSCTQRLRPRVDSATVPQHHRPAGALNELNLTPSLLHVPRLLRAGHLHPVLVIPLTETSAKLPMQQMRPRNKRQGRIALPNFFSGNPALDTLEPRSLVTLIRMQPVIATVKTLTRNLMREMQ